LVGKTTTLNQINVDPKIIRGGLFTVVGSGGATEAAISTGGILGYSLPSGKKAKFKGTITVSSFGSNGRLAFNIFDNVAGRIIPVGSVSSNLIGAIDKSFPFEGELENDDFNFTVNGNSGANDGACAVIIEITELPA